MSDFKLDIDYPFEIVKKEDMEIKPEKIAYPDGSIRYRHYGRFLEGMVKKAVDWEDEAEKKQLVNMLANQMKKSFCNWNKDGVEDQKIVDDLNEYSNGAINLQVEDLQLNSNQRYFNNQRRQQNNQRRQQNNNQRRKQH